MVAHLILNIHIHPIIRQEFLHYHCLTTVGSKHEGRPITLYGMPMPISETGKIYMYICQTHNIHYYLIRFIDIHSAISQKHLHNLSITSFRCHHEGRVSILRMCVRAKKRLNGSYTKCIFTKNSSYLILQIHIHSAISQQHLHYLSIARWSCLHEGRASILNDRYIKDKIFFHLKTSTILPDPEYSPLLCYRPAASPLSQRDPFDLRIWGPYIHPKYTQWK